MKKILLAVLLSSMFLVFSCGDDDENSLTSPSTKGKGTISFLLDGKVWKPYSFYSVYPISSSSHGMRLSVTEYDSSKNKANDIFNFEIGAGNGNQGFNLKIDSVLYEGKYRIKEAVFFYRNRVKRTGYFKLEDSLSNSNFVTVTKIHRDYKPAYVDYRNVLNWGEYTMDSYVSGTFEMTLKNLDGDSVVISNGRFDLKNQEY